ncbi:MAG: hypothetical protein KBA51_02125 [Kiritimatiellae bacterium]|nr:hypothetical protein [Kiritimatiellia bacterium]
MSAVNETLVREYLEGLGFLTYLPRKYQALLRARSPDEENDLLVWNPSAPLGDEPEPGIWTGRDLRRVRAAQVSICGWHTSTLSRAVMELSPELFRFLEADPVRAAERVLGPGTIAKVFVLPHLPADSDLRREAVAYLLDRGVTGIVSFRTILQELAGMADEQRFYDRSDTLQLLRLMKIYDLFKSPQLEFFRPRVKAERLRKSDTRRAGADAAPTEPKARPQPAESEGESEPPPAEGSE